MENDSKTGRMTALLEELAYSERFSALILVPAQLTDPLLQKSLAIWLDRGKGHSHPHVPLRISHCAQSFKGCILMCDSQIELRCHRERVHQVQVTAVEAQFAGSSANPRFGLHFDQFGSCYKWVAGCAA